MAKISILLKFGQLEHLQQLRKGILFMQPLSYFQSLEVDAAKRADSNEGLLGVYQPDKIKVTISAKDQSHELSDLAGPVTIARVGLDDVHAFCLFTITPGVYEVEDEVFDGNWLKIKFEPEHEKFGGYILCINNPKQFLVRVEAAIRKIRKAARSGLVEYVNETTFHGDIPESKMGFYKFDKFKGQREYRILIYNSGKAKEPIFFDVGDLSDITEIFRWGELDMKFKKNSE